MIVKIKKSTNYSFSLNYAEQGSVSERKETEKLEKYFGKKVETKGVLLTQNLCDGNADSVANQMNQIKEHHDSNLKNHCIHIMASFSPEDTPLLNDNMMSDISKELAEELGFKDCQYSVWKHEDKEHLHFHLIANRIEMFSGKTVSDSNDRYLGAETARKIESRYGLKKVQNPHKMKFRKSNIIQKKLTGTSIKEVEFKKEDVRLVRFRSDIDTSIEKSVNFQEFKKLLLEKGYSIQTGFGFSIKDKDGVKFSGKDLGKGYSKNDIDQKLDARTNNDQNNIISVNKPVNNLTNNSNLKPKL